MEFRQEFFWNLVKQPTRPLSLADGTLEVIKWLALVSMFYDHVMRIAWSGEGIGPATSFGRIAFPLFAFIMAYNLSRENVGPVVYQRTLRRLIGFGFLALPATYYFFGANFFNILFTFALAIALVWTLEHWRLWWGVPLSIGLFLLSPWVEYGWPGVLLVLSFFAWQRFGLRPLVVLSLILAFVFLNLANGNNLALLALFIVAAGSLIAISFPRSKWLFYVVYPLHLWILMLWHWMFIR